MGRISLSATHSMCRYQHECMVCVFETHEDISSMIFSEIKAKCLFWSRHRNNLLAKLGNEYRTRSLRKWMFPSDTKGFGEGDVGTVCYPRFM